MIYGDGSKYTVRIIGDNGKFVGYGKIVTFKLNGKSYKVKTNKNGYASLKQVYLLRNTILKLYIRNLKYLIK